MLSCNTADQNLCFVPDESIPSKNVTLSSVHIQFLIQVVKIQYYCIDALSTNIRRVFQKAIIHKYIWRVIILKFNISSFIKSIKINKKIKNIYSKYTLNVIKNIVFPATLFHLYTLNRLIKLYKCTGLWTLVYDMSSHGKIFLKFSKRTYTIKRYRCTFHLRSIIYS